MLVILEPVLDRQPGHADVNTGPGRIASRIKPQHEAMLSHRFIEQHDIDVVMKFFLARHPKKILPVGQLMSDTLVHSRGMRINRRYDNWFATPLRRVRPRRVPRGLVMLRALRLRLASEGRPRFHQTEFQFVK
jgi:hypothetical protein